MIPLLSLGIPANVVMAMLFSAFIIKGVQPGPMLMKNSPDLFWGLVVSMYVGNLMLVLLNRPLVGIWVQLLKIPYRILMPLILLFCLIGAYSVTNSTFDVSLMILFGGVGYLMRKFGYEAAPLQPDPLYEKETGKGGGDPQIGGLEKPPTGTVTSNLHVST